VSAPTPLPAPCQSFPRPSVFCLRLEILLFVAHHDHNTNSSDHTSLSHVAMRIKVAAAVVIAVTVRPALPCGSQCSRGQVNGRLWSPFLHAHSSRGRRVDEVTRGLRTQPVSAVVPRVGLHGEQGPRMALAGAWPHTQVLVCGGLRGSPGHQASGGRGTRRCPAAPVPSPRVAGLQLPPWPCAREPGEAEGSWGHLRPPCQLPSCPSLQAGCGRKSQVGQSW
jgi:hypothetical protein